MLSEKNSAKLYISFIHMISYFHFVLGIVVRVQRNINGTLQRLLSA